MNNIYEAEKSEPETTFEHTIKQIKDTIKEIKYKHLKIIASTGTNLSAIISFDKNFDPLNMKKIFKATQFEPELTFENNINEIKANSLKSITSIDVNVSVTTLNKPICLLNI